VPTATGANTLGEPWYRSRHVLPVRKDLVQETRYGLTAFALSMLHSVEEFTLSNPPLMSRKSVETFLPTIWRVFTSWVRVDIGSEADRPANQPHWWGSRNHGPPVGLGGLRSGAGLHDAPSSKLSWGSYPDLGRRMAMNGPGLC